MKRKRIIAAICALLCIALAFSGCGEKKEAGSSNAVEVSEVNEFPIVKEPITLSIFAAKNPYVENYETNEFTKWYEEKTNVHLDWNIASGEAAQALNLMIASDDYTDLIMGISLSKASRISFADQGVLVDMKPYIDEHGYYIKEMFKNNPVAEKGMTLNGGIYGLAGVSENYGEQHASKMWVYKPWLDKLGLEIPNTLDEFYDMLKAFKEQDPNGNGKADEVPLAGRGVAEDRGIKNFIMSAFLPEGGTGWYVEKDKVTITGIQPEYKEGLKFFKKLYDDGLLDPDTFIYDRSQMMALGENDPVILGCAPGIYQSMFVVSNSANNRYYEYTAIPPLEGPDGCRATVKTVDSYYSQFNVTTACENPAVAVKWIDWFYSLDGYNASQADKNIVEREAKPGELGVDGKQAKWTKEKITETAASNAGMAQNKNWKNININYRPFERFVSTCDYNSKDTENSSYKAYLAYQPYEVTNFLADPAIDVDAAAEFSELHLNMYNEMNSYFTKFVIGELDIEKDWELYIKALEGVGLDRYLELLQQGYEASGNN